MLDYSSLIDSQVPEEFLRSFKFIDDMDARDINSKLYGREGGLNGVPFFLAEAQKERKIRLNKTHMLRARTQNRFKSNCKPITSNYIHDRVERNQKHLEKIKIRRMIHFETEMKNQLQ